MRQEIGNLVVRIQATGADIVKVATTAVDITDSARIFQILVHSQVPILTAGAQHAFLMAFQHMQEPMYMQDKPFASQCLPLGHLIIGFTYCDYLKKLLAEGVHEDFLINGGINELLLELQSEDVTLYGGPKASTLLNIVEANSLHHEYSSMACTIEIVDDVFSAIDHINENGSAHTDCIITEDSEVAETFLRQVDSAAVFHNASTRFCDGARFGLGAEVGISTSRIHARGPVGVEGLLTVRWILRGRGQVVDGDKGVSYTHKVLHHS